MQQASVARRFLVTGTDTGVGKTTFACALASALTRRGLRVAVFKPAETGCEDTDGELVPADAFRLGYFSGTAEPLEVICPYRYRAPLAPAIAAEHEQSPIDLSVLTTTFNRIATPAEVTLVEGAGGLLVPITPRTTFADLARLWSLSLVVVVGNRLGAINHAQLTLRWAHLNGLDVAGYVVNTLASRADLAARTNVAALEALLGPALGVFPWMGPIGCSEVDRVRLAEAVEREIDLSPFV